MARSCRAASSTSSIELEIPPLVQIPVEALVVKGDKTTVAVVDATGKAHYRPVVVADDDGSIVRLVSGLQVGERVALNLGSEVEDGAPLRVVGADAK